MLITESNTRNLFCIITSIREISRITPYPRDIFLTAFVCLCLNYTLPTLHATEKLLFADKFWFLLRQVTSERQNETSKRKVLPRIIRYSLRFRLPSLFVKPGVSPLRGVVHISFSISGKDEGGKKGDTYTYAQGKNNKCYGSRVAEPAPAINHVSRVLKSTSKFSFKSHAVRFIKEHYWSFLLCNSCTRRPEIRAYVLSPFLSSLYHCICLITILRAFIIILSLLFTFCRIHTLYLALRGLNYKVSI